MLFLSLVSSTAVKFGIVIDAGSSGTRAHIYQWDPTVANPYVIPSPSATSPWFIKVSTPIAQCDTPDKIKTLFDELINYCADKIPEDKRPETVIYVYATAGMRLLPEDQQKAILKNTFTYLSTTKFLIKEENIRVISGAEEGVFGWISVNHLQKLFDNSQKTEGSIDLGGASLQIAFELDKNANAGDDQYEVSINGQKRRVFSHSFLGYGSDQAVKTVTTDIINSETDKEKTLEHPCYNAGYSFAEQGRNFMGNGNLAKCQELCLNHMAKPDFSSVTFLGIEKITKYYAMSSFSYLNKFFVDIGFPISQTPTFEELRLPSAMYCGLSHFYTENDQAIKTQENRNQMCFMGSYGHALLTKGFKLADTVNISMAQTIDGVDVSWTMGAMVSKVTGAEITPGKKETSHLTRNVIIGVTCALLVAVVVVIGLIIYLRKRKNPMSMAMLAPESMA